MKLILLHEALAVLVRDTDEATMSPFFLAAIVGFGGAVLFYLLSFVTRNTGGYQVPLDPFGPDSYEERELSRHEAAYNRNPKKASRSLAVKFLLLGILGFVLEIFLG